MLSLLIATHRRPEALEATLAALPAQAPSGRDWEVVVVDNANDPATQQVVRSFEDTLPVQLVIEPEAGQNAARNRAIPGLRGELVVFLDDDVTPLPGWLDALTRAAGANPDVDVFGGKILPTWPTAGRPWQADAWFASFVYVAQDLGDQPRAYDAGCLPCSPNMAIRRRLFEQGWRFNTAIGPRGLSRVSGSESEFFSRLLTQGVKMLYVPEAAVLHRIHEGMLQPQFLKQRCYTMGLGQAAWGDPEARAAQLLGVPRYRLRRICGSWLRCLGALCLGRWRRAIEERCRAAFDWGYCVGVWAGLREKLRATPTSEEVPLGA